MKHNTPNGWNPVGSLTQAQWREVLESLPVGDGTVRWTAKQVVDRYRDFRAQQDARGRLCNPCSFATWLDACLLRKLITFHQFADCHAIMAGTIATRPVCDQEGGEP